jgi:hypothetical protein
MEGKPPLFLRCQARKIYKMKALKFIAGIMVILLIAIQFFPAKKNLGDNGTANDLIVMYKTPADISHLLTSACYDCHSNHTQYPWYNRIQPVGWFLGNDIQEAKKHINLGEFSTYPKDRQKGTLEFMISDIEENDMPLPSYRLMHPEARLSEQEKQDLIAWLSSVKESL